MGYGAYTRDWGRARHAADTRFFVLESTLDIRLHWATHLWQAFLANFYDTNLEYRANRKLSLTGYFGYMQGLGSIEVIYPGDKNGSYGYGELRYRF